MRKSTDVIFHVGLTLKGIDAVFEVVGGMLLTMPTKLARYITLLAEHEAFRHHHALAGKLDNAAGAVLMHPSIFAAAYLFVHGLAKVILISAIFANKRWGYQGLFVILSLFATVELLRAIWMREVLTAGFAAFDYVLVLLIFKEYRQRFTAASGAAGPDSAGA